MVVTSMLLHGWVIVVGVIALIGIGAAGMARAGVLRRSRGATRAANAGYLPQLASVRKALKTRMIILGAALTMLGLSVTAFTVVIARPVDKEVSQPLLATRDIALCLDVSGSMVGYDTEIIDRFLALLDSFNGERIALSIWNQTSTTVFPLTDDYDLVRRELLDARSAMDLYMDPITGYISDPAELAEYEEYTAGTVLDLYSEESSLIGDGLASCVMLFSGSNPEERSRSIILASDNEVYGTPTIELEDATEYTQQQGIALIGIFSGDRDFGDVDGMRAAVNAADGDFYEADDPDAVPGILDDIASLQRAELNAVPEVNINDRPATPATLGALALMAALALLWWVRE